MSKGVFYISSCAPTPLSPCPAQGAHGVLLPCCFLLTLSKEKAITKLLLEQHMELFLLPHRLKPCGLQATKPTEGAPQKAPAAARGARAVPPESRGVPEGSLRGEGAAHLRGGVGGEEIHGEAEVAALRARVDGRPLRVQVEGGAAGGQSAAQQQQPRPGPGPRPAPSPGHGPGALPQLGSARLGPARPHGSGGGRGAGPAPSSPSSRRRGGAHDRGGGTGRAGPTATRASGPWAWGPWGAIGAYRGTIGVIGADSGVSVPQTCCDLPRSKCLAQPGGAQVTPCSSPCSPAPSRISNSFIKPTGKQ